MRKYFTLLMLILLPSMVMAQKSKAKANDASKGDKERFDPEIHKLRQHEFMTERAQLTEDDSIKFFAIYDEMRLKERELYGSSHEMRMRRPETDAECRAAMTHVDSLELATKQLQYDYHQRLLDAISPKKASIAIIAGEDFDRMTFRNMMRDWKHGNTNDKDSKANRKTGKGKAGQKGMKDEMGEPRPDGPRPGHGFHGDHPGGPGMEDGPAPDGPRPDGPAPEKPEDAPDADTVTK